MQSSSIATLILIGTALLFRFPIDPSHRSNTDSMNQLSDIDCSPGAYKKEILPSFDQTVVVRPFLRPHHQS